MEGSSAWRCALCFGTVAGSTAKVHLESSHRIQIRVLSLRLHSVVEDEDCELRPLLPRITGGAAIEAWANMLSKHYTAQRHLQSHNQMSITVL